VPVASSSMTHHDPEALVQAADLITLRRPEPSLVKRVIVMAPGGPMLALCAGLAGLVGVARAGCTVRAPEFPRFCKDSII
jgi:hypothetical protein